jgi:transposase-like protein
MNSASNLFKWKHFNAEIILLTVRWYHQYRLSYRDLVEMMSERGISISHTTIMRWVHQYAREIAIDFMLSEKRDRKAAQRFLRKALALDHVRIPRVITVDKNPAYPVAIENLKKNDKLPQETQVRQTKYLNNIIEQDHRFIKKRTNPMLRFKSFRTAEQTITGIETIHMIKKGQVECNHSSPLFVVQLIHQLFGLIA